MSATDPVQLAEARDRAIQSILKSEIIAKLSSLRNQELVNITLEHVAPSARDQLAEAVIEELCSRVYPDWVKLDSMTKG
jgi:hypothetical protein